MNLKKPDHETNFYTELLDNFVNLLEDTHKIVDQKINIKSILTSKIKKDNLNGRTIQGY